MAKAAGKDPAVKDHNTDRYPDWRKVMDQMRAHEDFPEGPIERVEITCLASGEGTWRVWPARAVEHVGGYVTFD